MYIDIPPLDPATSFSVGESISYDSNYNISSIVDTISNDGSVSATITHSYTYDEFNRILSFSNGNNGRVTYYEYDEDKLSSIDEQYTTIVNGVSTLVHRYVNLSYNTYKQLTSFAVNDNGITQTHLFTYDAFGNRYSKSINGVPKESYTFSHNQLMGLNIYEGSSTNHLDFFYDYQGIRIKKEYTLANNTKQVTYYDYDDDKLLGIKVNMMTGTAISHSYQLSFLYDLEGVIGFIYCEDNSSTKERYVFVKNILGDILYISEEDGTPFISYQYSDYGEESHSLVNASSLSDAVIEKYNRIASINPFRYRSYVYDEESKLYYLFARYYDPFTHTFISLDSPKYLDINTLEGTYLYCYCGDNPIMRVDPTGENWWDDLWKNVGGWIKTNWKELSIGIGMILLGSLTMGIGALVAGSGLMTSIVAAGVSFVQSSIQSLISGVFSGIIHGIISNSAGESFSKGFFSGLASGFMWGGIVSGVSNIIGGALTLTRALNPHFKFLGSNSFRLWSPNSLSNKHLGGTILNVKNIIRLDVDTVWRGLGLHLHIGISDFHLPAAWLIGILLDYDD